MILSFTSLDFGLWECLQYLEANVWKKRQEEAQEV